mmetsp:Transcript_62963/g.174181  ORF Transcript_62963/g.174181 Transcript_62963/m.174181 type:complete len:308 (-) Transcript_62963:241-1164(-)
MPGRASGSNRLFDQPAFFRDGFGSQHWLGSPLWIGSFEPIWIIGRAVVSEHVDIVSVGPLHRAVASVQALGTFVVDYISGCHQDFMQSICVILNFDGPRLGQIPLSDIDNQRNCVGGMTIDMRQQSSPFCVLTKAVHDGLFDLNTSPRFDHGTEAALIDFLHLPGDLQEQDIGFPPVHKDPLVGPFFSCNILGIVVVKGSQGSKYIIRQSSLLKAQRTKGTGDTVVTLPLMLQGLLDFIVKVVRGRSLVGWRTFPPHLDCRMLDSQLSHDKVVIRVGFIHGNKLMSQETMKAASVPIAVLQRDVMLQ